MLNKKYEKYQVVAVSQCEEIEASEILLKTDNEVKALNFKSENQGKYWNLQIVKICADCGEPLSECICM